MIRLNFNNDQIKAITEMVVKRLHKEDILKERVSEANKSNYFENGIFEDVEDAVDAAYAAQRELFKMTLEERKKIIEAIKNELLSHVEDLAKLAVEETGMGRYEDKIIKNKIVINKTPSVEDLSAGVFTGDDGLTLLEMSPFGVIGAITPSTNPTETVICNTIGMIAAGNSVVFAPHPGAYNASNAAVKYINKADII